MPPAPRIRLATLSDLPAIVAIYNATVSGRMVTADTEPVPVESRTTWFDAHTPEKRPLWVAVSAAGEVVAWLSYQSFYGRPAYDGTVEVSIYVAENARGQGLGRELLQFALDMAPNFEVHTLLGFIFGHNTPSLGLFAQLGFSSWAHLPGVALLDGVARDLVIVGKRLA